MTEFSWLCKISGIIWGMPLCALLLALGLYLSVKCGFFQVKRLGFVLKSTLLEKEGRKEAFASLGSCVGVGNITGAAAAVRLGGAGALFWIWVSAVLGMAVKYAEIALGIKYRQGKAGGPMYYMRDGLGSKVLSYVFAVLSVLCCFLMGNAVQTAELSLAAQRLGAPTVCAAVILSVLVFFVCRNGMKSIGKASALIVPVMSVIYVIAAAIAVITRIGDVPQMLCGIFTQAFDMGKTADGKAAMLIAAETGLMRGIFSGEAGLGTSPVFHAASGEADARKRGLWGVTEVFLSTVVICTVTGFAVLLSGEATAHSAMGRLIPLGTQLVDLSVILFAFSTIIGWQYLGRVSLGFITEKGQKGFEILYCVTVFFSSVFSGYTDGIWLLADIVNGVMTLINAAALIMLSREVCPPFGKKK